MHFGTPERNTGNRHFSYKVPQWSSVMKPIMFERQKNNCQIAAGIYCFNPMVSKLMKSDDRLSKVNADSFILALTLYQWNRAYHKRWFSAARSDALAGCYMSMLYMLVILMQLRAVVYLCCICLLSYCTCRLLYIYAIYACYLTALASCHISMLVILPFWFSYLISTRLSCQLPIVELN